MVVRIIFSLALTTVPIALASLIGVSLGTLLSPSVCLSLALALPLALIRARQGSSLYASRALIVLTLCGVTGLFALNASLALQRRSALRLPTPPGLRLLDAELVSELRQTPGSRVHMRVRAGGQTPEKRPKPPSSCARPTLNFGLKTPLVEIAAVRTKNEFLEVHIIKKVGAGD